MKAIFQKLVTGILVASFVLAGGISQVNAQTDTPFVCKPDQNLSEILGISWQTIWNEIQTGHNLKDMFKSKGKDYQDFQEQILDNRLSCVDLALAEYKISEVQAEKLKKIIQNRSAEGNLFGWNRQQHHGYLKIMPTLDELAEVFDMDPTVLKTELNTGKSLAQIADQQGIESEVVYAKWVNLRQSTIKDAVANGELDEDKGNRLIEHLQQNLAEGKNFGDWTLPQYDFFNKHEKVVFLTAKNLVQNLMSALNMSPAEIRESLTNDKTVQDLVTEKGINADELYHTWLNDQIVLVNQKLSDGDLTQEQADEIFSHLNSQLDQQFPWGALRSLFRKGMSPHSIQVPGYLRGSPGD